MIETIKSRKAEQQQGDVFVGQSSAIVERTSDFVETLFDMLVAAGKISPAQALEAKPLVRSHFGCERYYVAANNPSADAKQRAHAVLSLFNGRNAREVARRLGIGKTTVYRIIKQSGRPQP